MKKILASDISQYNFPAQLKLSPDGKTAAFISYKADLSTNSYLGDIFVTDLVTRQTKQLTTTGKISSFDFSDNTTIIFPGNLRDEIVPEHIGKTIFNTVNVLDGAVSVAFSVPLNKASGYILSEEKLLISALFDNNLPCFDQLSPEEITAKLACMKAEEDYIVCDELPFWVNGQGVVNKKRKRLYCFDKNTGVVFPITSPMFETRAFAISPDKSQIAYAGLEYTSVGGMNSGIYLYNLEKNTTIELVEPNRFNITALDFIGDKIVFPAEDRGENQGNFGSADIYSVEISSCKVVREVRVADTQDMGCLAGCDCRYGGGTFFKVESDTLYYITTYELTSSINAWKPGLPAKRLTTSDSFIAVLIALHRQRILCIGANDVNLQELFEIDTQGNAVQLTHINTQALVDRYVSTPEYFCFTNSIGNRIDGWVMKPFEYDAYKKYPAVIDIHGGPRTTFCGGFFHQLQMLASDGCFVMFCNPTGSAGHGDEFADITGKYGTVDYDDIMQFTDEVLKRYPAIDSQRLGVIGGSYGGFMTNWIIGHTDRFKAAVSQRSISNWVTMYATSDIGPRFAGREQRSTPWDNVEKMWWHSPLKYAKAAKTPTLFIHSTDDFRCWLPEAIQLYTALQLNGVETRMCMFKGENHELSRSGKPTHRIRRLEEMTTWLYKYIK